MTRFLTIVPPLDRFPRLVRFAQTDLGKVCAVTTFGLLLFVFGAGWWLDTLMALLVVTFFPALRQWIFMAASFYWLLRFPGMRSHWTEEMGELDSLFYVVVAGVFMFGFLATWSIRRYQLSRPVAVLVVTFLSLLAIGSVWRLSPAGRLYFFVLTIVGHYFWYLAYSLHEARMEKPTPYRYQVGYYYPFWANIPGPAYVPIPKGASYIREIECHDAEELAVVRLRGIKLLLWTMVLSAAVPVVRMLFWGERVPWVLPSPGSSISIDTFIRLLEMTQEGTQQPVWKTWWMLCMSYLLATMDVTIKWGVVVATCRMAGFRAFRTTYKPFHSRTLLEYWNRINYYVKELVTDLFFYPTFFRYFRNRPRLRLFTATFAAAGLGNFLVQLFFRGAAFARDGFVPTIESSLSYVVYSVLLGTGIGISQLRVKRHAELRHAGWFRRNVWSRICVQMFSLALFIFGVWLPPYRVTLQFHFILSLVGIRI
ncbi:MAG: hypothetical protein V1495_04760 [Pseudomonadota bacterium]